MSKKHWREIPIGKCLSESFAGEWGAEPNPANARILRATDINNEGQINLSGGAPRRVPAKKMADKRLQAGDILLEGSGGSPEQPVGRVAFFPGVEEKCDFLCSNFFRTLRPDPFTANPRFLFWKLMWFYKQPRLLTLQQQTTGLINLKFDEYKESTVSVPEDISEQGKVAEVIDTLDTAIHQTEAIVEKLKQVKQGLLHDLLTRGVDANGELRPSYEQAPELYQDSPLGWVPKAWDVVTLESVSHTVTSGSRDWARFYADSGALFVRIGNLTREHINFRYESTIYVRPPRNADGQRTRLESGDILISITADLGIIGVVPDGMGEAYINQHIALVRPNLSIINPRFVGHYLASPVAQTYISKLNDSGAKAGLNLPTIRGLITAKPIGDEQDVIATRLDEIDKRIQNATTESAKLRELKSGLMDDLLTGRVRVTPLLAQ